MWISNGRCNVHRCHRASNQQVARLLNDSSLFGRFNPYSYFWGQFWFWFSAPLLGTWTTSSKFCRGRELEPKLELEFAQDPELGTGLQLKLAPELTPAPKTHLIYIFRFFIFHLKKFWLGLNMLVWENNSGIEFL